MCVMEEIRKTYKDLLLSYGKAKSEAAMLRLEKDIPNTPVKEIMISAIVGSIAVMIGEELKARLKAFDEVMKNERRM